MKRQLSGVVSSGMTQEMDELGVSEGEGEGEALSTQEIDESARAWAGCAAFPKKPQPCKNRMTKMLVLVLAGGEGSGRRRGEGGRRGGRRHARGQA